jgi:hypothetical protein
VQLELDLPKAQTIPRAALHGDGVVIDLGQGVVGRIMQEQAVAGGLQLDKLVERLPSSEPLDNRTGTTGDLISRSLPRDLSPVERRTLCRGRQLQGPLAGPVTLCHPMAQRDALIPEAAIRRIEIVRL